MDSTSHERKFDCMLCEEYAYNVDCYLTFTVTFIFIVFMLFDEYLPVRCVSAALQRTVQYSDVIGNTIEGNFSLITLSLL